MMARATSAATAVAAARSAALVVAVVLLVACLPSPALSQSASGFTSCISSEATKHFDLSLINCAVKYGGEYGSKIASEVAGFETATEMCANVSTTAPSPADAQRCATALQAAVAVLAPTLKQLFQQSCADGCFAKLMPIISTCIQSSLSMASTVDFVPMLSVVCTENTAAKESCGETFADYLLKNSQSLPSGIPSSPNACDAQQLVAEHICTPACKKEFQDGTQILGCCYAEVMDVLYPVVPMAAQAWPNVTAAWMGCGVVEPHTLCNGSPALHVSWPAVTSAPWPMENTTVPSPGSVTTTTAAPAAKTTTAVVKTAIPAPTTTTTAAKGVTTAKAATTAASTSASTISTTASSTTTVSKQPNKGSSPGGNNKPIIVGVSIGVVALAVIILAALFIRRRRQNIGLNGRSTSSGSCWPWQRRPRYDINLASHADDDEDLIDDYWAH